MLFVVTAIDKEGSLQLRMATREAHLAYVRATGALRLGGPFLDRNGEMAGSMMIIEAQDLAAAREWQMNDPYAKAGLFETADVRPWKATANFCDARL